jgi:patatin-related protein
MSTNLASSTTKPLVDVDQEVRFAVVMYGGSSLAIYINGVAQELLRLVRATAPEFSDTSSGPRQAHLADDELRGSERVYRRLGRMLSRQGLDDKTNPDAGNRGRIRTRFVVDILTGTSAGGINAVYLAKALANDQDMDDLQKLWMTEADIGVLLNDKDSYDELGFTLKDDDYPGEPWSLLNSRRIHLRLLEALRQMELTRKKKQGDPTCTTGESPLVDELDLFVTATDMAGLVLNLRLADKVASEYRHRNVFRFRYRGRRAIDTDSDTEVNELDPKNNAFLAFAARATSAHQAAFSPVKFDDSTHIVAKHASTGELPVDAADLGVFYQDYLLHRAGEQDGARTDPKQLANAFRSVWFVDGGTLDNKPFSFVVQQLPLRHAETFVDRKLLYVEPSPEHLKRVEALKERPRIKENALAALSSLPRYETILEDLTRLLERNLLVERLRHIMLGAEEDLLYGLNPKQERTRSELRRVIADRAEFMKWLREKGPGWGSYQRLRVAEVTDDLTLLVARAAGFSEESDEFLAIRYLVRDWRDRNYHAHMEPVPNTDKPRKSQLEFLIDFDLPWAMRRVRFCLAKLNDLACLDEPARKIANAARVGLTPEWPERESEKENFRTALREMRKQLNEAFLILRSGRRKLWSRNGDTNPFASHIKSLELTSAHLLGLLRQPTDTARRNEAQLLLSEKLTASDRRPELQRRNDAVDALTDEVRQHLADLIDNARRKCSAAMRPPEGAVEVPAIDRWELFLRETLFYYYKYFDDFDQISYPILYSTGVGEEIDEIDVFRVSPEDATALIDESKLVDEKGKVTDGKSGRRVAKLAGTSLGNFGAFLRDKFRINDILWGRLDGAERIIAALLPANNDLCEQMTRRAHRAIIVEDRLFADKVAAEDRALQGMIWDALDVWDDPHRRAQFLGDAVQRLPPDSTFRRYVEELKRDPEAEPLNLFREAFFKEYKESRLLDEDASIKSAKRAQGVLSAMVLPYFSKKNKWSKLQRLVMWLGERLRIFVEAAIEPEGEARSVQRRKLAAAYIASLLILALVCLPAFLMMFASEWPWPGLGFLAILLLTFPFAFLPLVVTVGYNLAWLKLRGKIKALLVRLRGT